MSEKDVDNLGKVPKSNSNTQGPWRVERNISLGVIISLILHTCGLVWFLASLNAGLANLKESNVTLNQRITSMNSKIDRVMTTDEVMRLHDYTMDRLDNLDSRVRILERDRQ